MRLVVTDFTKARLRSIYLFYKENGQIKRGRMIRSNIINKALHLKQFPMLGQEEEYLKPEGLGHRYLVEDNYKIIYRISDDTIYITDIFDTRQDPGKMLSR